jgi:hypothetical protein
MTNMPGVTPITENRGETSNLSGVPQVEVVRTLEERLWLRTGGCRFRGGPFDKGIE